MIPQFGTSYLGLFQKVRPNTLSGQTFSVKHVRRNKFCCWTASRLPKRQQNPMTWSTAENAALSATKQVIKKPVNK